MATELPILPSNIGKRGKFKMPPHDIVIRFTIIDEILKSQLDLKEKIICLQRLKFDDGREEIRLGYYIIGKKPAMRGKWVWGQFTTTLPLQDFNDIVNEAKSRGWM